MNARWAFLRLYSTPLPIRGWRGAPLLGIAVALVVALPQARALVAGGVTGGTVIGVLLILSRHRFGPRGPRRGTPITLFPRPVLTSSARA